MKPSLFYGFSFGMKDNGTRHCTDNEIGSPPKAHSFQVKQAEVCVMKTRRSFARGRLLVAFVLSAAFAVASALAARPSRVGAQAQTDSMAAATPAPAATPAKGEEPKPVKIDLAAAVKVTLPAGVRDLQPAPFKTSDGKEGW